MLSGRSGGHLLLVALIFQGLGCCRSQANMSSSPHNRGSISINTVTYPVTDGGSSPLISGIGTGILDSLAYTPTDATLLELTSHSPDYATVRDYTASTQSSISSFITYTWVLFGVFTVAIVVIALTRLMNGCGALRKQRVTQNYMLAYVFYVVSLVVLVILCVVFLVWLILTNEAMSVALREWAPDLYDTTFLNLRLFVNMTLDEIAERRKKPLRSHNVSRVLGPDFGRAFQSFIADSVMEDVRVPLYHMARDCASDLRYLGRILNAAGHVGLGVRFRTMGDQCAHIHRDHEELFGNVAQAVAQTTASYRYKLLKILTDSMSTLDASDVDVKPSYASIDMLQMKLQGFEEYHGLHKYLSEQVTVWLWLVLGLFFAALSLLVVCLVIGVAVHRQSVPSHKRSQVSNFLGYLFIITAYIFSTFVILAIATVIYLTVYNTVGYCHFCGPYSQENYAILDDATDRLWPVNNRSQLLSKIIPSEIIGKCQNESVSIFDLGPMPSHRRTFRLHDIDIPQVSAQVLQQKLTLRDTGGIAKNPLSDHEELFRRLLASLKNVSSTDSGYFRDARKASRSIYDKWHIFWARRNVPRLSRTSIERVLVPMVPSYFRRFVERVTQDIKSSAPSSPAVIGPCFIIYNLITSIMDVICKGFVLELVAHWATLLFSIVAAIFIIIICFWLSKYFFRTHRRRKRILRRPPRRTQGRLTSSSAWTESTESSEPSVVSRTIFVRTTSRTSTIPYPFYVPDMHSTSMTSFHVHPPMPFRFPVEPSVVQSSVNRFTSVPAILHHHPIVSMTSEASMHHAMCSGTSSHVPLRRISSLTAIHSEEHTHSHATVVTPVPVRHTHSWTTVVTPVSSPPPQQVIVPTPPPLPAAPVMMAPPVIIQPPVLPQVVYPPPSPPPPAPLLPLKRRSSGALGGGQAANQQAATAHTTINFYGSPAPSGYGLMPQAQPMYAMPSSPMYAMPTSAALAQAPMYQYAMPTNAAVAQAPAYQYAYQTAAPVTQGTAVRQVTSLSQLYRSTAATTPASPQYQYAYATPVSQRTVSVQRVASTSHLCQGTTQVPATTTVQYTQCPTVTQVPQGSRTMTRLVSASHAPAYQCVYPTVSAPRRTASVTRVAAQVATSTMPPV